MSLAFQSLNTKRIYTSNMCKKSGKICQKLCELCFNAIIFVEKDFQHSQSPSGIEICEAAGAVPILAGASRMPYTLLHGSCCTVLVMWVRGRGAMEWRRYLAGEIDRRAPQVSPPDSTPDWLHQHDDEGWKLKALLVAH
jgi:hypothetical protein